MQWCEFSRFVKYWGSECVEIPYVGLDGKTHRYYPDYFLEMENGDKIIVEIKPKSQTIKPLNQNCYAWQQWQKNCLKWKAAKEWCERNGMKFWILTEDTISRMQS